jgi:hypothetical protein
MIFFRKVVPTFRDHALLRLGPGGQEVVMVVRIVLVALGAAIAVAVVAMLLDLAGFPPSGGAIGGAVGGGLAGLMMAGRGKRCPRCGTDLPATRWPTSFRQAIYGGWTCQNCGCEVDRHGNALGGAPPASKA